MSTECGQVCRVGIFLLYCYAVLYEFLYIKEAGQDPLTALVNWRGFPGKFKFLTYLNSIIQTVYFGVSVVNDVWGSSSLPSETGKKRSGLQNFRDTFLASIVYPVGTFVVMTFWGIYAVDRELVYPKKLDGLIPSWLNHVMHTTVLPFLLVEKYFVYHRYPSRRKGISILLAFALLYLSWILWIAYYSGFWVYPVLQVMEAHQRAIFILILAAFFVSIYIAGESINRLLWISENKTVAQKSLKKTKVKKAH